MNILKGRKFVKKQKDTTTSIVKLSKTSWSNLNINKNEKLVCRISEIYNFLHWNKDVWTLEIPDIESIDVKITDEEFEKIEYIIFVDRSIMQYKQKKNKSREECDALDQIKSVKQLRNEFSKEYRYIENKKEKIDKCKDKYYKKFKEETN